MNDKPLPRRGSKLNKTVEYLRAAILQGRLAPGQRLVEVDLTNLLRVSRSLLREAFRQLAAEELIEIVPNRGALVRRLTVTEAVELFQIRAELEALAGRLAAGRIADGTVRSQFECEISPIWLPHALISRQDYVCENQTFHNAIMRAAGNGQLTRLNEKLQLTLIMSQISSALTTRIIETSIAEHRAIAEAILEGDQAAAARKLRTHLARATSLMAAMPSELFRPEKPPAT